MGDNSFDVSMGKIENLGQFAALNWAEHRNFILSICSNLVPLQFEFLCSKLKMDEISGVEWLNEANNDFIAEYCLSKNILI
jgi:hypothetical protein